jgi:hypothetical protein
MSETGPAPTLPPRYRIYQMCKPHSILPLACSVAASANPTTLRGCGEEDHPGLMQPGLHCRLGRSFHRTAVHRFFHLVRLETRKSHDGRPTAREPRSLPTSTPQMVSQPAGFSFKVGYEKAARVHPVPGLLPAQASKTLLRFVPSPLSPDLQALACRRGCPQQVSCHPGKRHTSTYIFCPPLQHHPRGIVGFHCLAAPSFQLRNSNLPNNTFKARRHTPTPCRYPSCFQSFLSDTDTRTHYNATNSTIPSYHHVGLHSPLLQVRSHARHQH